MCDKNTIFIGQNMQGKLVPASKNKDLSNKNIESMLWGKVKKKSCNPVASESNSIPIVQHNFCCQKIYQARNIRIFHLGRKLLMSLTEEKPRPQICRFMKFGGVNSCRPVWLQVLGRTQHHDAHGWAPCCAHYCSSMPVQRLGNQKISKPTGGGPFTCNDFPTVRPVGVGRFPQSCRGKSCGRPFPLSKLCITCMTCVFSSCFQ